MATKIIQLVSKADNKPVYVRTSSDGVNCDGQVWKNYGVEIPKVTQGGVERIVLTKVLEKVPDVANVIISNAISEFRDNEVIPLIEQKVNLLVPSETDTLIKNLQLTIDTNNQLNLKKDGTLVSSVGLPENSILLLSSTKVPNSIDYNDLTSNSDLQAEYKALSAKATIKAIGNAVGWTIKEIDRL